MKKTIGAKLQEDPRVIRAKQLINEALSDHQTELNGIRPADPELKIAYASVIEQFGRQRGAPLFYPYLGSGIGKGALVELADGSVKYDLISGIGVHYFGHSHPQLVRRAIEGALSDTILQGNLQQNQESAKLTNLLIEKSGLDHCFLTTSGAMANENGLKIAMQKRAPANRVLAFERGFAGRTWAFSQISDKPAYRKGLPSNIFVDYIPFYDPEDPVGSTERAVAMLECHLSRYPGQHACMIFELIQGEAGCYPGTSDFFVPLMERLKAHEVAVFVDEVQTFGRTSSLFAFHYFDLLPYVDIVTIGKMAQVCATLFTSHYNPQPGLLSQTFTNSSVAIGAALVITDLLLNEGCLERNMEIGHRFALQLERLAQLYPEKIRGPWGLGAMVAFTPFDGSLQRAKELAHALFDAGVMSFIAGREPTRIRFLPPVGVMETHEIDAVIDIIERTICSLSAQSS